MKKDTFWDQLISAIAGLGVPGLVLLVVMASTGFAGAAAITTALATLGGPFGMMGGIAVLGVLSMISKGLTAYGLDAIFNAVVDDLKSRGISEDEILKEVLKLPVPANLKKKIKKKIEDHLTPSNSPEGTAAGRRLFVAVSLELPVDTINDLRELHSAAYERIRIASKLGEGVWEGLVEGSDPPETVQVVFKEGGLREFISTTRDLSIGERYQLVELQSGRPSPVLIEVKVADGFWLGVWVEPGRVDEIVNIVYQNP